MKKTEVSAKEKRSESKTIEEIIAESEKRVWRFEQLRMEKAKKARNVYTDRCSQHA